MRDGTDRQDREREERMMIHRGGGCVCVCVCVVSSRPVKRRALRRGGDSEMISVTEIYVCRRQCVLWRGARRGGRTANKRAGGMDGWMDEWMWVGGWVDLNGGCWRIESGFQRRSYRRKR